MITLDTQNFRLELDEEACQQLILDLLKAKERASRGKGGHAYAGFVTPIILTTNGQTPRSCALSISVEGRGATQ